MACARGRVDMISLSRSVIDSRLFNLRWGQTMRQFRVLPVILAVLSVLPGIAKAQSVASITGVVTDASGASVPGASIKLVDTRTGQAYFAKTAGDGSYRIVDVPPGPDYSLTVKKDGFQTSLVGGLYLPVATPTTQDIKLQLGTLSQTVEVTAEGSVTLNTTDTTIGNNLDLHAVSSLPNEFRDDPSNLLRLQVGVVSAQSGRADAAAANIDPNGTRDGSVAGARPDQNNIVVDGIDAADFSFGFPFETQSAVPVDAIQEFSTQVANPSAAYGGRSGAQTIITTKSGTNTFHGSAFEYNRTAATEANTFFNNQAGVSRLALVRNQWGANVGGPVLKDKLFFFFEYDGRRDASAQSVLQIVPFPHVGKGEIAYINDSGGGSCPNNSRLTSADVSTSCVTILSAAQVAALDPCSGGCPSAPGFAAAGVAPALLSLFNTRYPAPNDYTQGDGLNTAGFRFNAPDNLKELGYLVRVDYSISSNNKLFGRFNLRNSTGVNIPNQFPGDPLTAPALIRDRAWVIGDTWTINSNAVNQFTAGETRANDNEPVEFNPSGGLYELTFMSGAVSNPYVRQSQIGHIAPDPTLRDDVTLIRGKHSIVFGGEFNPVRLRNTLTNDFTFIQQGLGGAVTGLDSSLRPADILPDDTVLNNWDGFFVGAMGIINNVQAAISYNHAGDQLPSGAQVRHDWRIYEYAGYVQDAWRIRNDLTISMGLRYQYQTVPYETNGIQASFLNTNLNAILAARERNGLNGVSGPDVTPLLTYQLTGKANNAPPLYSPERHDFSPRLALAWNPAFNNGVLGQIFGDRKTVLRTGAALIYDQTVINAITQLEDQSDYTFGNTYANVFGGGGTINSLQTDPRFNSVNSVPFAIPPVPFVTPVTPSAIFNYGLDNQLRTPYQITASFGLQRELPAGLQLEADYYGRFGRRLLVLADAGQTIDFVDPASKQSLSQAFTVLEKDAQQGVSPSAVTEQPFFANQMEAGTGLSCPEINSLVFGTPYSTCAQAVYAAFQSNLAQGNTGGLMFPLSGLMPPNVGLTPQFIVNALATNKGFSSYNALFTTLRKRLSNNLQLDFNYTFSHSIDNNTYITNENGNFAAGVTTILCDATSNRVCRGNSEFDATHQISADFVYDLPFGRGQAFGHDVGMLLNEAIGGWQVSGIETWRTGLAMTAQNGIASTTSLAADAGDNFTGSRSALASHIHVDAANGNQIQFYANPSAARAAFTPVTGLQVGTRDNLRGPHFSNLDLAVSKNFPIASERYKLQFRAEAYNLFNHPNFGLPDPTLTSPSTFGVISGLAGTEPSRVMQFALRFDF
jgi:Carboxypeptidase regulatory-like domain